MAVSCRGGEFASPSVCMAVSCPCLDNKDIPPVKAFEFLYVTTKKCDELMLLLSEIAAIQRAADTAATNSNRPSSLF